MKKIVSVMMLTLALGAIAFTQAGGGGGAGRGQRGGGGGRVAFDQPNAQFGLVSRADVQADLKLTDDQKSKLADAVKARGDAMQAARSAGGDRAARQAANQKASADFASAVGGLLTADQKTRIMQIFVQVAKNLALENPDVQSALGLSSDQVASITKLRTDAATANASLGQQQRDGTLDRTAAGAARRKNGETLSTGLAAVLTANQAAKFKGMEGPHFEAAARPARPGGAAGGGN